MNIQARYDLETAEEVPARPIKKSASHEGACGICGSSAAPYFSVGGAGPIEMV
jgi:hypothetical protein